MIEPFVQEAWDRTFPGLWEEPFPGTAAVVSDGVGILMMQGEREWKFGALVLADVPVSEPSASVIAYVNKDALFGNYYLAGGQSTWLLVYQFKFLRSWMEPSRGTAQMFLDVLANFPAMVKSRGEVVREAVGGTWCVPEPGWPLVTLGHL